jgi:hypothetical protein
MWLSAVDHGVVGGDEVFVAEPDPGRQDRQGTAAVPGLGDHSFGARAPCRSDARYNRRGDIGLGSSHAPRPPT